MLAEEKTKDKIYILSNNISNYISNYIFPKIFKINKGHSIC